MGLLATSNPVLEMLKQDHSKVKKLFEDFDESKDSRMKERIIRDTLLELEVHAKLEERSSTQRFEKRSMRKTSWMRH
jgi:hypothetical protein